MTRSWPMKEVPGEERDHPHHRSLWYSHGAVNGVDFWSETPKAGKIVHDRFLKVKGGEKSGVIRSINRWIGTNGEAVLEDERTFRVYVTPRNERLFDYEVTLYHPNTARKRERLVGAHGLMFQRKNPSDAKPIVLGDTKEGSMAIRVNESMRLIQPQKKPGKGRIVLSTGVEGDKTWGKQAAWCDYSGPVDGKTVGVALFDHPSNPRHPTWWHVRDYGLFAANPFGVHDFEKKPPGTGDLQIPPGKSVTFKYRFYLHEGDEKEAKVAERWQAYVDEK